MLTNKITRHPSNQISTAVILFAGGVLPLLQKNKMIRTINTFICHLTHGGTEGIAIKQHVHCKYIPINHTFRIFDLSILYDQWTDESRDVTSQYI